jgi:hypothetical protein
MIAAGSAPARAQDDLDRYERYAQSPAVGARYGDVPIRLDTPALAPGRTGFTTRRPSGTMAAMALEPDLPGSLVGVGLIPLPAEAAEAPIYRVVVPITARLAPLRESDATVCAQ